VRWWGRMKGGIEVVLWTLPSSIEERAVKYKKKI
jgi:hypothetical protein